MRNNKFLRGGALILVLTALTIVTIATVTYLKYSQQRQVTLLKTEAFSNTESTVKNVKRQLSELAVRTGEQEAFGQVNGRITLRNLSIKPTGEIFNEYNTEIYAPSKFNDPADPFRYSFPSTLKEKITPGFAIRLGTGNAGTAFSTPEVDNSQFLTLTTEESNLLCADVKNRLVTRGLNLQLVSKDVTNTNFNGITIKEPNAVVVAARAVGSNNFAWLDANTLQTAINPGNGINILTPEYIKLSTTTGTNMIGMRTGSVFINKNIVSAKGQIVTELVKPVFVREGTDSTNTITSNAPGTTNAHLNGNVVQLSDSYITNTDNIKQQSVISIVADRFNNTIDANRSRFWDTDSLSISNDSIDNPVPFTPNRAATLQVDLFWQNDRPVITRVFSKIDGAQVQSDSEKSLEQISNQFKNDYFAKALALTQVEGPLQATRLAIYNEAKEEFKITESYLDGAIRVQNFPLHSSYGLMVGYYLVVDPHLFSSQVPTITIRDKDGNPRNIRGIFVNVLNRYSDTALTDEEYNQLLNRSLLVLGSKHTEALQRQAMRNNTITTLKDTYTAAFNDNNIQYFLGTNGRITFDTTVNVNPGTLIDAGGALLSKTTPLDVQDSQVAALTNTSTLQPILGDVLTLPTSIEHGAHKSVFSSRLTPAYTFLNDEAFSLISSDSFNAAIDTSISASEFIHGKSSTGVNTGYEGVFKLGPSAQLVFLDQWMRSASSPFNFVAQNCLVPVAKTVPVADSVTLATNMTISASDAIVNEKLKDWARNATLAIFQTSLWPSGIHTGTPTDSMTLDALTSNPCYNPAVARRLSLVNSTNSQLRQLGNDLYDEILSIDNRNEVISYVKTYYQRYGWNADINDNYLINAKYNVRVMLSGTIKSNLYRNCIDNNGNTTEILYQDNRYILSDDSNAVNMRYHHSPEPTLRSFAVKTSLANTSNPIETISSTSNKTGVVVYSSPNKDQIDFNAAFRKFLSEPQKNVDQVLSEYENPLNNTLTYATAVTTENPKSFILTSAEETRLKTALLAVSEKNLMTDAFKLGGTEYWTDLDGYLPFFGRIEYTLVASVSEAKPANVAASNKIHAAWTLDTNDSVGRIAAVKVERYVPTILSGVVTQSPSDSDGFFNYLTVTYPNLLTNMLNSLDAAAFTQLGDLMNKSIYSVETLANQLRANHTLCDSPVSTPLPTGKAIFNETLNTIGGVTGRREWIPAWSSINNTDYSWALYNNETSGHGTNLLKAFGDNVAPFASKTIPDVIIVKPTKLLANSPIPGGYDVTSTGDNSIVRTHPTSNSFKYPAISRDRYYFVQIYGQKNEDSGASPLNSSNIVLDTTKAGDIQYLSTELLNKLVNRDVRFTLFANLNGSYNTDMNGSALGTLASFTGVGTLITGSTDPNPFILGKSAQVAYGPDKRLNTANFTWHGTIISGLSDTSNRPDVAAILPGTISKTYEQASTDGSIVSSDTVSIKINTLSEHPNLVIYGDPIIGYGGWGTLSVLLPGLTATDINGGMTTTGDTDRKVITE